MGKLNLIARVISGGQTGADTGALIAARRAGVPTGGWAAKYWETEEGSTPFLAEYGLKEFAIEGYRARTIANVTLADAVLWFGFPDSPGARLTFRQSEILARPVKRVENRTSPKDVADWIVKLAEAGPIVLMVSGNRASRCEGIQIIAETFMGEVFKLLDGIE